MQPQTSAKAVDLTDFDLVYNFLNVGHGLGEFLRLIALRWSLHATLQDQRSILGVVGDVLVVEVLVRL